ncbi:MAG TPA: hypothetical protein VGC60_15625 [Pyrinomonadaceae bacterium]
MGELNRDVTGNYEDNAGFNGVCRRWRGVTAEEREDLRAVLESWQVFPD